MRGDALPAQAGLLTQAAMTAGRLGHPQLSPDLVRRALPGGRRSPLTGASDVRTTPPVHTTLRHPRGGDFRTITHFRRRTWASVVYRGMGVITHVRCGCQARMGQARLWRKAKAVASALLRVAVFRPMFSLCRSIVRTLRLRAAAIARLLLPAATRRSTSTSRAVNPAG